MHKVQESACHQTDHFRSGPRPATEGSKCKTRVAGSVRSPMPHGFGNAEVCATTAKAGAEAKAKLQNDPGCRLGTPD